MSDPKQTFLHLLEQALLLYPDMAKEVKSAILNSEALRLPDIKGMAWMLNCSEKHVRTLISSGELKEGRDYIDISSRNSKQREIRFITDAVIKTLKKPALNR